MKTGKRAWIAFAAFAILTMPTARAGRTSSRDIPGPGPLVVVAK